MTIHAGTVRDVEWQSGTWVFLDIGFSNKKKSCGLLIHDEEPRLFRFNDVRHLVADIAVKATTPVNLVIEAPLSVAFDRSGNPIGRRLERQDAKTRYWYNGLGCSVMVAAMYLVRTLNESCRKQSVRLFEGFVSYKDPEVVTDHLGDVLLMRSIVKDPASYPASIISPESLKSSDDDRLLSAFCVAGMDFGVPPVIKCEVTDGYGRSKHRTDAEDSKVLEVEVRQQ